MRSQYGVGMYSPDFRKMKWTEFKSLLIGLSPDSPLGILVQIRAEEDENVLKNFTPAQHKIRDNWRRNHLHVNKNENEHMQFLAEIQNYFKS